MAAIKSLDLQSIVAYRRILASCLIMGFCGVYIAITSVILEYPIGYGLGFSATEMIWVALAYTTIAAGFVAIGGQISKLFKYDFSVFIWAIVIMFIGTLLLSISTGPGTLYTARILQGFAISIITPCTLTIIQNSVTPERRAKVSIYWSLSIATSLFIGALIGALCTLATWRLMYWIILPVFFVVLLLIWPYRKHQSEQKPWQEADYIGALLYAVFAVIIVLLFSLGFEFGWTSSTIISFYAIAPTLLLLFLWYETKAKQPILNYKAANNRNFILGISIVQINFWSLYTYLLVFTLYTQSILGAGYSFFVACMTLLPFLFACTAGMISCLYVCKKYNIKHITSIACICNFIGFFAMVWLYPTAEYIAIWWAQVIAGLGIGITIVIGNMITSSSVEPRYQDFASSCISTCLFLGASIGAAIGYMIYRFVSSNLLGSGLARLNLTNDIINSIKGFSFSPTTGTDYISLNNLLQNFSNTTKAAIITISKQALGNGLAYTCLLLACINLISFILTIFYKTKPKTNK